MSTTTTEALQDVKMEISEALLPMDIMPSNWTPMIEPVAADKVAVGDFDPKKHLQYEAPAKIHTMQDLGLPEGTGVSPVAVSEPFRLFASEAVHRMRQEVLQKGVWDNCQYSSNLAQCQLRGFASQWAPFVYDTWKNPVTLSIISKIAGVDLVTEMDFEIAHINISVKSEEQKDEEVQVVSDKQAFDDDEGIAGCPWEDDKPIVQYVTTPSLSMEMEPRTNSVACSWHTDAYPFVCVTMLSDCTNMIGGETALRTGTGGIIKVRGPEMGSAVILQGRHIEHQALRAIGTTERITNDTVLTTVRPISDLTELYSQYTEYRLEILEERLRTQLRALRDNRRTGKKFNVEAMKYFFREQEKFLAAMNKEIVEEGMVQTGNIDDSHLLTRGRG
ncbi:MAG: hypothetical protein LQ350_005205 [Teloschistes chrysophthalmus]|nr:MAG: hypothetical protein LQ350_005205 [Niorma chrysophthalma]